MVKKIIVLNGTARTGKDTFAQYLKKITESHQHVICEIYSTVATIKAMLEEYFHIPEYPKTDAKRKLWCDTKGVLTEYEDVTLGELRRKVEAPYNPLLYQPDFIFAMVREPQEIEKIWAAWPERVVTVLLTRECEVPYNSADCGVWDYTYDYTIDNNGSLEDLRTSAEKFYYDEIRA